MNSWLSSKTQLLKLWRSSEIIWKSAAKDRDLCCVYRKDITYNIAYFLYNFLTYIFLIERLNIKSIFACGLTWINREGVQQNFLPNKDMKTGNSDHIISSLKITSFLWNDNKSVRFACVPWFRREIVWRKQNDGSSVSALSSAVFFAMMSCGQ
jgi:hypothetical protein